MAHQGELPVSAAGDAVLFATAGAGGWVGALRVYSGGFECALRVIRREPLPPTRVEDGRRVPNTLWDGPDGLRIGLRYEATGQSAAYGDRQRPLPRAEVWRRAAAAAAPPALTLTQCGGHGDADGWSAQLWAAPLPPGGPVVFFGTWAGGGVAEFAVELDGDAIAAAATGATRLWGGRDLGHGRHLPGVNSSGGVGVFTVGERGSAGPADGSERPDGPDGTC